MKIAAAAAGLALMAAGLAPGAVAQSSGVSIPDTGLRSAIEDALGKQSGDTITESDMARLTSLDASYSGVARIDGLEHAANLRALYLQGNRISDASSLTNLTRMQVLFLHNNDISEIDVTRMTDLRFLNFGNNELSTIDLSGQRTSVGENNRTSRLYALWLHGNRLASIDLSGLTALSDRTDGTSHPSYVSLRLDRNRLSSVTGLADLPGAVWSLRLEDNLLTSIDLSDVEHIHYLYLDRNPIARTGDISGFSELTDLRRLHLYDTEIRSIDLSPFSRLERAYLNDNYLSSVDVTGLDSIQRLWLRGNRITSLTGLEDIADTIVALNLRTNRLTSIDVSALTGLRQLYLSDNALTSIDVAGLSRLEVLWLHNRLVSEPGRPPNPGYQNQITSLGRLPSSLTDLRLAGNPLAAPINVSSRAGLRKLYVSGDQISGISAVSGLTGLTELALRDMVLTSADLSALSRLSALEKLDLSGNSIWDVSPLASFARLTELRLNDNSIPYVSPLSGMTSLEDLYVAGNRIADFSPLAGLVAAGLTIHGRIDQTPGSPDDHYWDIDAAGSVHGQNLSLLAADGILDNTECGLDLICPNLPLERWALAVWLVRVLDGSDPEPLGFNRFEDVHPGLQWAAHVERLAKLRVTVGCATNPARYCPQDVVTGAQMASFLARAFSLQSDTPAGFVDVGADSVHAAAIDAITAAGITLGCATNPARFCPGAPVTRGQAASLLSRARSYVNAS